MNLSKINEYIESLPKRIDEYGRTEGNEFSFSGSISGSVSIITLSFEDYSFEIQKEGSHFLILSRYYQGITGIKKFENNECIEDELIKVIDESCKLRKT